jgi:tetratricopeptide (TPR) repeat protein
VLKLITAIAALILASLSPPLAAQQPADHIALGIAANDAHDLRTALLHFQAALAQDSTTYGANWRAALVLMTQGELAEKSSNPARDSLYALAVDYARRAVASDPAGADGHFALAAAVGRESLTLGEQERIRRAAVIRSEALRTLALNPRHDGAYHILGRWNAEIMRLSGVSRFVARNFLGAGVFKQASWTKAIYNMEKAVKLDSGRIYHRLELAEIYTNRKRYGDAERQLALVDSLPLREVMDSVYKRQGANLRRRIAKR